MHRVDIDRKRTTPLPWLAGLVILAVILWGVTSLLAAPQDDDDRVAATTAEDTLPPAAIPAPPHPVGTSTPRPVVDLATLDHAHLGQRIQAEGEVVATGTAGFWIMAASAVIRVDSERPVRKGQSVALEATVETAEAEVERTDRIVSEVLSRHPESDSWNVVRSLKLVERHGTERRGG